MTFMDKVYILRTEVRSDGKTVYFISLTDGHGEFMIWRYLSLPSWNFVK